MNSKSPLSFATASLVLAVVLCSCSGASLEKKAAQINALDDHLSIRGRVCTDPPDPNGFPVKVVILVDQSGSMCISDPPGSQGTAGLCEQFAAAVGIPAPARVRALQALTAQFAAQPNVQVSIVPWDTNVKNVWPPVTTGQRFARPIGIDTYIQNLQSQLGKGTDFQGALSYAYGVIASDIADTNTNNPQLLPRTRYVVVLLTDGTPYPRCSANDDLSVYADPPIPSSSGPTRCPTSATSPTPRGPTPSTGSSPAPTATRTTRSSATSISSCSSSRRTTSATSGCTRC